MMNMLQLPKNATIAEIAPAEQEQDPFICSSSRLLSSSRKIANILRKYTAGANIPVGVAFLPSTAWIIGLFGVIESGGIYAPLETEWPGTYASNFIYDTQIKHILVSLDSWSELRHKWGFLNSSDDANYIWIFKLNSDGELDSVEKCFLKLTENITTTSLKKEDSILMDVSPATFTTVNRDELGPLAYGMLTSGSTGSPVFVKIPHSTAYANLCMLAKEFCLSECDVMACIAPAVFDTSIVEVFVPLLSGATLLVLPKIILRSPSLFIEAITKHKVSCLQCTPSFLAGIRGKLKPLFRPRGHLRCLVVGGEPMTRSLIGIDIEPECEEDVDIFHVFGLTECSVWTNSKRFSCKQILSGIGYLPLGLPLKGYALSVCDLLTCEVMAVWDHVDKFVFKSMKPFSESEWKNGRLFIGGQICVVGNEIHCPWWRDTGDIVQYRQNGEIVYVNRAVSSFKRLGQIVFTSKIEEAIRSFSDVIVAVHVIFVENTEEIHVFILTNVPVNDGKFSDPLLSHCYAHLPSHMYPDIIHILSELPLNDHGKVDVIALKKHASGNVKIPTLFSSSWSEKCILNLNLNECTKWVADVWHKLLPCSKVLNDETTTNSFFLTLGGTSSMAAQAAAIITRPLRDYGLDTITVNELSSNLTLWILEESLSNIVTKLYNCLHGESALKKQKVEHFSSSLFRPFWEVDLGKCIDSTPLVMFNGEYGNICAYIGSHSGEFKCISAVNGNTLWSLVLQNRIESSAVGSYLDGEYCVFFGCNDGFLYCCDATNGSILWKFDCGSSVKTSPILHIDNSSVFTISHEGCIFELCAICGYNMANKAVDGLVRGNAAFDSHKNLLYVPHNIGSQGNLSCFRVEYTSESHKCVRDNLKGGLLSSNISLVWVVQFDSPLFSKPLLLEESVIIGCCDGNLYCLSSSGLKKWKFHTKGPIFSSAVCYRHYSLCGSNDGHLYCLCSDTGMLVWKMEMTGHIHAAPSVLDSDGSSFAIAASTSGQVIILDISSNTPKILSSIKLDGSVHGDPVALVVDSRMYVWIGCRDDKLHCLTVV